MFNHLNLKATYSTYCDDIAKDFYEPVLSNSVVYDRATAYFSSKALANYAKGLECFSTKGYKYRLIISTQIKEEDYLEIIKGYEIKDELKKTMLESLNDDLSIVERFNLSNLSYLIANGTIEIKMAFTKVGIFHDKFGIVRDERNNIICFRGSNNETDAAFKANYESFDITCSWNCSNFDYSKITNSTKVFEELWSNKTENIYVTDIDSVIKDKLLSYNEGSLYPDYRYMYNNCLLLDIEEQLILKVKLEWKSIINSYLYKFNLKRYINNIDEENSIIYFKDTLVYTDYKKIIRYIEKESTKRNYDFYITDRLNNYISDKELYINERSNLGLAIKQKNQDLMNKFNEYRDVVNDSMHRKLRDQQMWDSFFMFTMKRSSNFSVPGSGKTSSVLGVYAYLSSKNLVDKIVMIGPKNSFISWEEEFNECFKNKKDLNMFSIQNIKDRRRKSEAVLYDTGNKNLLLFNYESLSTILDEISRIVDNRTLLVFDEVHKVKAIQGKRAEESIKVSKKANFIITMTGTPIPNSYSDIKNILNILYHDEYKYFFGFSDAQLSNPSENDISEINSKLQPFFCRTTKEQLKVTCANDDIILDVCASENENKIFNILCMKYSKNKLALIIRILQLESNPKMLLKAITDNEEDFSDILYTQGTVDDIDYIDYSDEIVELINSISETSKFKRCISQILELYNYGKKCIVWCIFVDSIYNIKTTLEKYGLRVGIIYGGVDNNFRNEIINDFKLGLIDVLITNPHTLAESVSLHKVCHDAVYFEYSYNLVHMLQSKDRIHRLGLPNGQYTQYYFLQNFYTTSDNIDYSLDEKIHLRLIEKEKIMLDAIENNYFEPVTVYDEEIELIFKDLKL